MINDVLIPYLNSLTMALCVTAGVTWWPTARKALCFVYLRELPPKIYMIGLGIIWLCFATFLVRGYSIAILEYQMDWLRDHWIVVALFANQASAFACFALGYAAPRASVVEEDRKHTMSSFRKGLLWGAITLAALVLLVSVQ